MNRIKLMSNYSWSKYNLHNEKLSSKIIKFNQLNNVNFIEEGIYNHIRDIFSLSLIFINKKKIKVLDYGSNILALSNLKSKINTKFIEFSIYDPFYQKTKSIKPFKINFINHQKELKKKKFDIINFGSSIQYIENLNILNEQINFKTVKRILITHTPFCNKSNYITKQTNHKNLIQNIYTLLYIKHFFKNKGFQLVFKSRNHDKYIACKNMKSKTYSLNLIFEKNKSL